MNWSFNSEELFSWPLLLFLAASFFLWKFLPRISLRESSSDDLRVTLAGTPEEVSKQFQQISSLAAKHQLECENEQPSVILVKRVSMGFIDDLGKQSYDPEKIKIEIELLKA
jgi:hypothetical protein